MKVAYIMSNFDASNFYKFPGGIGWYIIKNLKETGCEFEFIHDLPEPFYYYYKLKTFFYKYILKKNYSRFRETYCLKKNAEYVDKILKRTDVDLIFSFGSLPVAYLKTDKPKIFWSDTTFAGLIEGYDEYKNFAKSTIESGHKADQAAFDNCNYIIFSSEWTKKTAIENYRINPSKIVIIPFGSNLENNLSLDEIKIIINERSKIVWRFIFTGVDWKRKGLEQAINIIERLHNMGFEIEFNIIGCSPPIRKDMKDYIKIHGFLNKNIPKELEKIKSLYAQSHFLIHLAKAEAFGHIFCEANSFGVPCIANDVGGIPSVIRNGINGQLFSSEDTNEKIIEYIIDKLNNYGKYHELALSSFHEYQERLNWGKSAQKVKFIFEKAISNVKLSKST